MKTEFENSNMMHWCLKMCCRYDLIKLLKSFSNGIGCGICETMLVLVMIQMKMIPVKKENILN